MINIGKFSKAKNNTASSSSSTGGGTYIKTNITGHYLWGNYFDATQNINGDIKAPASTITAKNVNATSATISNISTNALSSTAITSESIATESLDVADELTANAITSNSINNANTITTKDLEVTGTAHFFELMIDKVRSVGGRMILSDASMEVDAVITQLDGADFGYTWNGIDSWDLDDGYEVQAVRLVQKAEDTENVITNDFADNDLIICQSFNLKQQKSGSTYTDISNKYYRSTVLANGIITMTIGDWTGKVKYIDIALNDTNTKNLIQGTVKPEVGDTIVQLGNSYYTGRQNAICISSYNDSYLDPTIKAPSFVQYQNISGFTLNDTNRQIVFSPSGNKIVGDLTVTAGSSLATYIDNKIAAASPTLTTYYAYNTKASDSGCQFTDSTSMTYIGILVSTSTTQPSTGYKWMKKGDDTIFYKFVPIKEEFTVDKDKNYSVNLQGYVYLINGSNVTLQVTTPNGYAVGYRINNSKPSSTISALSPSLGLYSYATSGKNYDSSATTFFGTDIDFGLVKTTTTTAYTLYDCINVKATMAPTSIFSLTDDQIKLQVIDKLGSTGINITSGKINVNSNNFRIQNNGSATTLSIDAYGNLISQGTSNWIKLNASEGSVEVWTKEASYEENALNSSSGSTYYSEYQNGKYLVMLLRKDMIYSSSQYGKIQIGDGSIQVGNITIDAEAGLECDSITDIGQLKFTNSFTMTPWLSTVIMPTNIPTYNSPEAAKKALVNEGILYRNSNGQLFITV